MKLLYLVPNVNNEGGVARVLSIKANYLVEKLGYQVHILTQNEGNSPLFYDFNNKIVFHDMTLRRSGFQFINSYRKALKKQIKIIKPDIIVVCDFGLKAFTVPFLLNLKIPIVFECHGSKYIEENKSKENLLSRLLVALKHRLKDFGASRFSKMVVLSDESLKEWNVKNAIIIPNPLWLKTDKIATLESKKVIAVGRHTYEKGFDRLLQIWQKTVQKHPDWILEIYGKSSPEETLQALANSLKISKNVVFFEPVKNIEEKYNEASIYLMTSRYEGFGMVLIEAMASGLPCIAYDCPCGPRSIIDNDENGFLIEEDNENLFIQKLNFLIEDKNTRKKLGENARVSSEKYNLDSIMQTWNEFFRVVLKK